MKQKISSIFFLLIFTALITAPSVIMVIDDSIDISCLYSLTEEEEEKENNITKEGKIFYYNSMKLITYIESLEKFNKTAYFFKTYQKPHLNIIFSPPEFIS
ncbi:hypothetical protein [Psychroserpens sp. Hel_I_66]|uniref:hypothetical protein n=1 Tax=Psychroserpens sp. Hel_I_66 TaxID=1250004 RepID=UPI000690DC87|nr:hypothetical protein [Psychroserpens sp. Hel_I_66]